MRRFLPLVLLCVGAAGAHLHAGPPVPQAKAANSPFSVLFAATIQYAEPDAWEHTPASSARAVEVAEEIVRGQRVNLLLSFTELAFDDAGRADVVYDVSLRAPDGSVQVLGKDLPAANDVVPEANRHLVFRAVRSVGFAVPATGPLGTYRPQSSAGPAERFIRDADASPGPHLPGRASPSSRWLGCCT